MTGTPWLTYEGIIKCFHTTIKGKTEACLPKAEFRGKEVFDSPKVLFGYSENHWVTKETMREQVLIAENYRRSVVQEKDLPKDAKMIVLWDIYCRHRDDDLKSFMAQHCPNIIVLFVPANLTEKGQPLDIFFNAILKVNMYKLRDARIMGAVTKHMEAERNRQEAARARGEEYEPTVYKPATKLSEIKEPFYLDLAQALKAMQTPELIEQLHNKAWGLFKKCFDPDFQRQAVQLVTEDTRNGGSKYFSFVSPSEGEAAVPVDPIFTSEPTLVMQVADAHNALMTANPGQDAMRTPKQLVGRRLKGAQGSAFGKVTKWRGRKKTFEVKYYRDEQAKRATNVLELTHEGVLSALEYGNDNGSTEEEQEVTGIFERNSSDRDEGSEYKSGDEDRESDSDDESKGSDESDDKSKGNGSNGSDDDSEAHDEGIRLTLASDGDGMDHQSLPVLIC